MSKTTANLLQGSEQPDAAEHFPVARTAAPKPLPMPPLGRLTRKARAYQTQIAQLRAQGYTLEAIRQGLEAVGIKVCISTVHREVRRASVAAARARMSGPPVQIGAPVHTSPAASPIHESATGQAAPDQPAPPSPCPSPAGSTRGKDLAEAFMNRKSHNPLVRAKEHP